MCKLLNLFIQQIIEILSFNHQGLDLAFHRGPGQLQFFFFGSVLIITVLKFLFVPCDKILVLVQLSFEFGFAVDYFVLFIVSHLVSLDYKFLHLAGSVVDNLLEFVDLAI